MTGLEVALLITLLVSGLLSPIALIVQSIYYMAGFKRRCEGSKGARATVTEESPHVVIHVPVRGEDPSLLAKLVSNLKALAYPREKLTVIVVSDDEPNAFRSLERAIRDELDDVGWILVNREEPKGRKAGALNYALPLARGDVYVVLDADSTLPSDYLLRAIPLLLQGDRLGAVVPWWTATNANESLVSEAVALAEDFSFKSLFMGRYRLTGTVALIGSGCLVKGDVLESLGGWDEDCLLEDVELGLRIASTGLRVAPSEVRLGLEVPATYDSLKSQQARWAYGATQLLRRILMGRYKLGGLLRTLEAALYVSQYLSIVFTLIFTFTALLVPLSPTPIDDLVFTALLAYIGLASAVYSYSFLDHVRSIGVSVWRGLRILGRLSGVTMGMAPSLTASIIKALLGLPMGWRVTPKGPRKPRRSRSCRLEAAMLIVLAALALSMFSIGALPVALWMTCCTLPYVYVVVNVLRGRI